MFANITATSQALLDFAVPNGGKLDVTSQPTEHLASSMTLLNYGYINGSLAYLYSSARLNNTLGTKDISLQDAIAGFRNIEPYIPNTTVRRRKNASGPVLRPSLLYGRMYFPGNALEAMVIKRISTLTQLLLKCISNPLLNNNGILIVYLQDNTPKSSREFIYLTNESLFGFRCLYNFGKSSKALLTVPKFDNSVVSVGAELWYAALTMSPGFSTAVRYSTRSTYTGKPLTMTIACNPILGHISSTYNVKTLVSSTVCSKYDFNWFSYASNLSVGFELYNSKKPRPIQSLPRSQPIHHDELAPIEDTPDISDEKPTPSDLFRPHYHQGHYHDIQAHTAMADFQNLVNESKFSSVIKGAASLSDQIVKFLWVGRYKDFLVSAGVKMGLNSITNMPEVAKVGIGFSYAC